MIDHQWGKISERKEFGLFHTLKYLSFKILKENQQNRPVIIHNFVLMLVLKMINTLCPLIFSQIVNMLTCDPLKNTCASSNQVFYLIFTYSVLRFAYDLLNDYREIPFANISASCEISITQQVYDHINQLSLDFHLNRETGKVVRIISKGSQSFALILRMVIFQVFPIILEVSMVLLLFFLFFSWKFSLVQLISIILYVYVTTYFTEKRAFAFKKQSETESAFNQIATDAMFNFETVKYFNAEDHELQRFEAGLQEYKKASIQVKHGLLSLYFGQSLVVSSGLCITLLISSIMVDQRELNVGDFIMFNIFVGQIYQPLVWLGSLWRYVRQSMVDVEQVFNLLEVEKNSKELKYFDKLDVQKGDIEFRNVSFSYENNSELQIKNVSFKIPDGKSLGIVGPTGSGKSTLVRLLFKFYDIQSGQILIDNQNIQKVKLSDLRKNVSVIPQDCILFNETILYNIAYGSISQEKIQQMVDDKEQQEQLIKMIIPAAKRAQIHEFIMEKQNGYWETVGERGLKLSGGEKQRVAIARALFKKSKIICFDEATSSLDTHTEQIVQESIRESMKGVTSIVIAHRLSTVKSCDQIIFLKNGEIVEQGNHQELLQTQDGYYKNLWFQQKDEQRKFQMIKILDTESD